jgi:hypothetical protein
MTSRIAASSPRLAARVAGALYVVIFVSAPSGAATATPATMVINLLCDSGVALLFYHLLQPVSGRLAFFAALSRIVFVAVMTLVSLNYFGALPFLPGAHSAASFNQGYGIALIPFGLHCALIGYLIWNSTFLPRILGALMILAGAGYLIFIWPSLGNRLFFPYIVVLGVAGEGALTLWLLIMGVNAQRWCAQNESGAGARLSDEALEFHQKKRRIS